MKESLNSQSAVKLVNNQRGQGLIEYLIIVALMGVATIAIVRTMSQVVLNRFAHISHALQGKSGGPPPVDVNKSAYQKRDLSDFMKGAAKPKSDSSESSGEN